jgi:ubiquinone/menaquinone biosynthesis C-methylase UbiE
MAREDKQEIQESYNALGGRIYDIRYSREQEAKYEVVLDRISPQPDDVVLDDGCGTGLLLHRLNAHLIGLDFSHKLLEKARSRLREKPGTHLVQADADRLPFRPSVYSLVFAVTLLQNTPMPRQTLSEMRRVGRHDSQIVVTALKKAFSAERLKELLEKAGLSCVKFVMDEDLNDWFAFTKPT